ncbi:hypothetical protein Nepgr_019921 [Nepenthes gracilis]|uniref:BHLH domain-containing protein n=1 Tax=Nepenthes gracilis TaxID=150966 RepID=A0AAD3SUF3_NEPGR|nr:hypothetical protein Nepgr_019921 [Nepenthes gracilis]
MDSVFNLNDADSTSFLLYLMHSYGCTYAFLWSYSSTHNCLYFKDGYYHQLENNQASSSSAGSLAYRLFEEYRQQTTFINVENDLVPGLAFKRQSPFMELRDVDLQRLASTDSQRLFYLTAVFMACRSGEIELGMSNLSQVNLEMEMKILFPQDFSQQALSQRNAREQNRPSSSSSFSMDSPEYSSLLFNIPSSSYLEEQLKDAPIIKQSTEPMAIYFSTASLSPQPPPQQPAFEDFSGYLRDIPFPTAESTDSAIARAILTILSSSASSSSSQQTKQNFPYESQLAGRKASAFTSYKEKAALEPKEQIKPGELVKQNMRKRGIAFLRGLNFRRRQEYIQESRPATQLQHMILERRRREKINESFQALRSLLPPGSKKDKASVLTTTSEYLGSLKAQISELSERNQQLEAQLLSMKEQDRSRNDREVNNGGSSSDGRLNLQILPISESTSEARIVELQVNLTGNICMLDLVIEILEFLKRVNDVELMSVEAHTAHGGGQSHHLILRLAIEGSEWDESSFKEAVKRVAAHHLPKPHGRQP